MYESIIRVAIQSLRAGMVMNLNRIKRIEDELDRIGDELDRIGDELKRMNDRT
jgi:hypothetical protein